MNTKGLGHWQAFTIGRIVQEMKNRPQSIGVRMTGAFNRNDLDFLESLRKRGIINFEWKEDCVDIFLTPKAREYYMETKGVLNGTKGN